MPTKEASVKTRVGAWESYSANIGLSSSARCSAITLAEASSDHLKGTLPVRSVRGFANVEKPLIKVRWNPTTPRKACTSLLCFKGGAHRLIASS